MINTFLWKGTEYSKKQSATAINYFNLFKVYFLNKKADIY